LGDEPRQSVRIRKGKSEAALLRALFPTLAEHVSDWICVISPEGHYLASGGSLATLFGYREHELLDRGFLHGVDPEFHGALRDAICSIMDQSDHTAVVEYRRARSNGGQTWVRSTFANRLSDTVVQGIVVTTAQVRSASGLPDRGTFVTSAARLLATKTRFAAIVVDLNNHRQIATAFGGNLAQRLLESVARRIQAGVRPGDLVAQVGPSEFAVLVADLSDDEVLQVSVDNVSGRLRAPIHVSGREVVVTASLGYAICEGDAPGPERVLSEAEAAAHRASATAAKKYDSTFEKEERRRVELSSALPRALERSEFQLRYQPIVDLHTGQIVGAEALIRWMHQDLGTVPPNEFIPIAEASDAVMALDRWVMQEAAREATGWLESPVRLSVNISGRHLDDPRLPDTVATVLGNTGLPPSRLRIEVTETAFVGDVERSIIALQRLRELGISVAMDDFGTGYASFAQLADLPLDVLKIDRTLVNRIGSDRRRNVLPGVISMAQQLGLAVVGEGIETRAQWNALRNLGCNYGQGFLFSRPVSAADFLTQVRMQVRTDHATLPPKE